MVYKDFREYLARLEQEGELLRVQAEVDWNLEIGAITKRCGDLGAPAPLFENVKGYPRGFRVLGSPVGASSKKGRFYARLAMAMGLPPTTGPTELVEYLIRGKSLSPVRPQLVRTAPCKECIETGPNVDLLKLPVPYLHEHDGGRYIGTWHVVVTKDPTSDWVNWGLYRLMVHDAQSMGGLVMPTQHIGMHYAAYEARHEPMPFAVAIGTEPLIPLIASTAVPEGVNEADVIGGLRGAPVEVVTCETVDLEVPAGAEIVIEGYMAPGQRREEGPFGEYSGYQARGGQMRPVYQVTAVTHRKDPILPAVCAGTPVEDHLCMSIIVAADILHALRETQLPVSHVFIPPAAALHLVVVSVKEKPQSIVQSIADAIWANKSGQMVPKIIVVDDDVDATDMNQVMWAFSTRNNPGRGIRLVRNAPAFPLWPFPTPRERAKLLATKAVFDCTWPTNRPESSIPRKASFDSLWPAEVQEKVLRNWTTYGFPPAQ